MTTSALLCVGFGIRLWPISRQSYSQPFFSTIENKTLFRPASQYGKSHISLPLHPPKGRSQCA